MKSPAVLKRNKSTSFANQKGDTEFHSVSIPEKGSAHLIYITAIWTMERKIFKRRLCAFSRYMID